MKTLKFLILILLAYTSAFAQNNVIAGQKFYVAKVNANFSDITALNSTNINTIYWIQGSPNVFKQYRPGNGFNTLTAFVKGESYQIAAKLAFDLTAYLGLPDATGGSLTTLATLPATTGQRSWTISSGTLPTDPSKIFLYRNAEAGSTYGGYRNPVTVSGQVITLTSEVPDSQADDIWQLQYLTN